MVHYDYLKGIYVQWHFPLLQGTTCSFVLVAHQILLRGQTLRPRNMPKGCGNKMPLWNFPDSLAFAFRWQLNKADRQVGHDLIGMYDPSLHHSTVKMREKMQMEGTTIINFFHLLAPIACSTVNKQQNWTVSDRIHVRCHDSLLTRKRWMT